MRKMEKQVLVTGSSGGIGGSIVRVLAKAGYRVTACYRGHEERVLALQAGIREEGGSCELLRFDIADRKGTEEALNGWLEDHGAPWGVVCNAGICRDNVFPAMDGDDWDQVLHTNLDGFYNVVHPLVMPMCRKRKGRIVVMSSISGIVGNRGQVNYSASKAGLIGASKALAAELASRSITVNCIAPGIIDTEMLKGLPMEELLKLVPMKRLGKPEEVAALVLFLLSEEAGYITRQVISVNGGME